MGGSKENVAKAVNPDKKATLTKIFEKLRNDISCADELVTELEVPQDYKGPHYDEFCQSYTKTLLLTYCHSLDDAELMLASYGLLPKLEYSSISNLTERRVTYYQFAHEYSTLLKSTWAESSIDSLMRRKEDKIIAYLVDDLIKALSPESRKLNFMEQMSEHLKRFSPRYLCAVENDPIDAPQGLLAVLAPTEVTDSKNSAGEDKPVGVGNDESMSNSPTSAIANSSTNAPVKENSSRESDGGKGYHSDRQIKNNDKDTDDTDEDKLQKNWCKHLLLDSLTTPINPLPLYIMIVMQALGNALLILTIVVLVLAPQFLNAPSERPNTRDYAPPAVSDSSHATVNGEMVEPSLFNP